MSVDLPSRPRERAGRRTAETPPAPSTPAPPRLPARRNPTWIALGVVALCLGALLSYAIYASLATDTAVVAVSRTVYRGEVIDRDDVTKVVIQGSSFPQAVRAGELEAMIGKRAAFDLVEGSIVLRSAVTDAVVPGVGKSVVGLRLANGRAPASLLLPSSPVRLVGLPPNASDSSAQDEFVGKTYLARVIDQAPGTDGTSILVNVEVATDQAPTIALLSAQDRLTVVRDPER